MAKVFEFDGIRAVNFIDLDKEEIYRVLSFRNHPSISKWMYHSAIISVQAHLDFIENLKNTPSNVYWLFKQDDVILGVGSLTRVNIGHKNARLGLYKNPELSRMGDKIIECLQRIAFDSFGLHALMLEVIASNKKAIACYERNDFVLCGCLKDFALMDKGYQDVLLYQKINPHH